MDVELLGHRGFREWQAGLPPEQQTPENSIAAFQQSYSPKGLDGVELDVHLSRDDQLVVFHDDDLNELTDVADLLRRPVPASGPDPLANVNDVDLTRLRALQANDPTGQDKIYIADLDLNEIQALRLRTNPDPGGVRHTTGHGIPTLTEVFRAVDERRANNPADNGKFKINIEVKEAKMYQRQPGGAVATDQSGAPQTISKDIAGAVTRTVDEFLDAGPAAQWSKADNLVVSSFHKMTLGRLRHADEAIPRRALYSTFVERDFRVSDDGNSLEMKHRGATNQQAEGNDPRTGWITLRPALDTDRLFTDFRKNQAQNERIWDMTERELTDALETDAHLPIEDLNGAPLLRPDGQPLVGVAPRSVAISISEMTPDVAKTIRESGAEICVWTANEQMTNDRLAEETSALLDFLDAQKVTAFITDNSDKMVLARNAWSEQRSQQQTTTQAPAPALAEPAVPSVTEPSASQRRSPSPPPPAPTTPAYPAAPSVADPPVSQRRSPSPPQQAPTTPAYPAASSIADQPEPTTLAEPAGPSTTDPPASQRRSPSPPPPAPTTPAYPAAPSVADPPASQRRSPSPPPPAPTTSAEAAGPSTTDPPASQRRSPSPPPPTTSAEPASPSVADQPASQRRSPSPPAPTTSAEPAGPSTADPPASQRRSPSPPPPTTSAEPASPSVADQPASQRRSPSPPRPQRRPPEIDTVPDITTTSQPPSAPPSPSRTTGGGAQPQRRRRNPLPLIPEDLPAEARPLNNDGSTPLSVHGRAAGANALNQLWAMGIGYGFALAYITLLSSRRVPDADGPLPDRVAHAIGQALLQAPLLAIAEESMFGLGAEAGAAALGGAVVPRSDPYPEFKLPALPENPPADAIARHNTGLEYVRTRGGSAPDEAPNHPFSALVLYPDNPADADFHAQLNNYNDAAQVELRRKAEGIFRNRPLELSDYPEPDDHAPSHVRDGQQWRERRHNAEVAYANDVLRQAGDTPIPDRAQDTALYDQDVRDVRDLLEDRSHRIIVARLSFLHDQRSADYGALPIDIVLISAFAICAGAAAASLPNSLLQSVWGTALAGVIFGAVNNFQRLQNRHFPDRLPGASGEPQPAGAALPANNDIERVDVPAAQRTYPNGIPTHYVLEGSGPRHGATALGEIWNSISHSERLSEGVLGARNTLEKVRNHAQQYVSYLIGSSYGLTAYNVVRTLVDHALGGSDGRWQSFVRETAATAAFVACGDLSILHHSVSGRRGVTDIIPAYSATREAFGDLWKRMSGQDVFSTVDRNGVGKAFNWGYDTLEKTFRLTQHALMDTADVALRTVARADGAGRRAATEEYFGRNAPPPRAYGELPYQTQIDRAGRASAIQSLSGDKPLSDDEAVKRLKDLRNQAEKFWPAQNRLETLWGEILTSSPATQQPPAQEATQPQQPAQEITEAQQPVQEVTQTQQPPQGVTQAQQPGGGLTDDQPPGDLLAGWQPTQEQIQECDEVLRDLKQAREAIEILQKAEINVARARSEQATQLELTSIVDSMATQRPVERGITALLQQPETGIDHKTFEAMLDRAINDVSQQATAQGIAVVPVNRQDLLTQGYNGINERTVSMVSEVMAGLVKNGKQESTDVAAVMETLVDDARRTGMTENRFNQIVREQFHHVARGAPEDEVNRLNNARHVTAQQITNRYTRLGDNAIDNRRRDVAGKEQTLARQVQAHKTGARR